jgi:uncharacterized membrane protein (UPF0127 family)
MTLIVRRNGQVALRYVEVANTHWQKFKGLMFVKSLGADEGLLIEDCRAIHCCFMKIPIDVVYVSADGHIVHLISSMQPWRFSKYVKEASRVLECHAGTIAQQGWSIGDVLTFIPS